MKKISIILSTVVAASLLALASCSNVTELNGNQYDSYKAGASGLTLAQATAAETEAAKKITFTVNKGSVLKNDAKIELANNEATLAESYTWDLASKATAVVAADTYTVTIAGIEYKNAQIKVDDTKVTFNAGSQPGKLKYVPVANGSSSAVDISATSSGSGSGTGGTNP